MSYYRRAQVPGGTYFFTVVTAGRQKILTNPDIRAALRAAIAKVRLMHPFIIDGWVLLPDHLHCIWTLPESDADFSTRWRLIKREVSVTCGMDYLKPELLSVRRVKKQCGTLWQHRFWEHWIRNDADYAAHMDYLHFNPVKHGLVDSVSDWPWSSFHRHVAHQVYAADWGGRICSALVLPYDG
ncbi:MAG: transposase [Glaciimonas sp.]|nr:transposase [Glaciimonas sp.]